MEQRSYQINVMILIWYSGFNKRVQSLCYHHADILNISQHSLPKILKLCEN